MTLDREKLTAIGHADHVVCNPVSLAKVDEVLDLMDLARGARVLDAGCGKAEILMRLIEKRGVSAVGVDTNARFLEQARRSASTRVPPDALTLVEADIGAYLRGEVGVGAGIGADGGAVGGPAAPSDSAVGTASGVGSGAASSVGSGVRSVAAAEARARESGTAGMGSEVASASRAARRPAPFDAALCTGSTHAFGGYRQTLRALAGAVRPGGILLVGEGYWKKDPDAEYLAAIGASRAEFTDHAGNVARGVEEGLVPLHSAVSSDDEWDRYEGLYLRAVEGYAAAHPEDPDTPPMRAHIRRWRDAYLKWGRDTLGFGLYVFRRDG